MNECPGAPTLLRAASATVPWPAAACVRHGAVGGEWRSYGGDRTPMTPLGESMPRRRV